MRAGRLDTRCAFQSLTQVPDLIHGELPWQVKSILGELRTPTLA